MSKARSAWRASGVAGAGPQAANRSAFRAASSRSRRLGDHCSSLATIAVSGGAYAYTDITDCRQIFWYSMPAPGARKTDRAAVTRVQLRMATKPRRTMASLTVLISRTAP